MLYIFQFQDGTIRSGSKIIQHQKLLVFQFQDGTIRSMSGVVIHMDTLKNFNSRMVRLGVGTYSKIKMR